MCMNNKIKSHFCDDYRGLLRAMRKGNESDSSKHFIFAAYCFLISESEKRHKQSCLKIINIEASETSLAKVMLFVYFM